MPIWEYGDAVDNKDLIIQGLRVGYCPFCDTELKSLLSERRVKKRHGEARRGGPWKQTKHLVVDVCPTCGWWRTLKRTSTLDWTRRIRRRARRWFQGNIASLRKLSIDDVSTPLEEIRAFLVAKYESRFDLHPKLFEETVASVFRDLGYQARVTAYSSDGGIDVVLDGPDKIEVGVQVKRYKDSIEVEQIRAFTGALLLGGYTKGIFVTTSQFQSGANKTTDLARLKGIPIELMDAGRFYDALRLAQRECYRSTEEFIKYLRKNSKSLVPLGEDFVR